MLTSRKAQVLSSVVDEYIGAALPVSSDTIVKKHRLGVSSATVRNDMSTLESEGYLTRPHPSSGAVPSDKGYRFYVESISSLQEVPYEHKYTIRYQLVNVEKEIESWTRLSASMLAQLVNSVAIVTYPQWPRAKLAKLDLVYVNESLTFIVVVLEETRLRKQLLPLGVPIANDDLHIVANKLTYHLHGLSREEIVAKDLALTPFEEQIKETAVSLMAQEDRSRNDGHYVDGLRHLLRQPEFSQGDRMRDIIDAIEDSDLPKAVLAEVPGLGNLKVVIGEENRMSNLHPFSMVICQYGLPGGGIGSISALGPTRMEYPRMIAGVKFVSSLMSEMLPRVAG